jgi:hypothetical protein
VKLLKRVIRVRSLKGIGSQLTRVFQKDLAIFPAACIDGAPSAFPGGGRRQIANAVPATAELGFNVGRYTLIV